MLASSIIKTLDDTSLGVLKKVSAFSSRTIFYEFEAGSAIDDELVPVSSEQAANEPKHAKMIDAKKTFFIIPPIVHPKFKICIN